MALDCPDIEQLINEIRAERHWREDGAGNIEQFLDHIAKQLSSWAQRMIKLCKEKKYDDHEKVIKEIVELRIHIDNIFPKSVDTFVIDVFDAEPYRVITEHYFSPQPFYPNDNFTSLRKHVKFTIFVGNQVIRRFFLESSQNERLHYVLGSSSADYSFHRQHIPYLAIRPTYIQLKNDVIEDLTEGSSCIISSYARREIVPVDRYN
ncbi:uncharacterized protein LOC119070796 isoform X1 [Bradysia coprophila]|uniref:uncharacterized protein LOC119070796 isoform X1 n=1 Tax=Bradysia coprophila TaxID=38358 RepID=UPI00187DBA2B|nr:uncharacterized protein LOC119070796 isoform X1 [Bradysia coprophila]